MEEKETEFDYSGLIILKELEPKEYTRIYRYIRKDIVHKIKTPKGIAISIEEWNNRKTRFSDKNIPEIDFTEKTKINSLYKRIRDFNRTNQAYILKSQNGQKLKRYQDQNGLLVVNLMDYINPQIKQIAHKLEVKEYKVRAVMAELLKELYKQE